MATVKCALGHRGYAECPDCETEVKLGDYEYD